MKLPTWTKKREAETNIKIQKKTTFQFVQIGAEQKQKRLSVQKKSELLEKMLHIFMCLTNRHGVFSDALFFALPSPSHSNIDNVFNTVESTVSWMLLALLWIDKRSEMSWFKCSSEWKKGTFFRKEKQNVLSTAMHSEIRLRSQVQFHFSRFRIFRIFC